MAKHRIMQVHQFLPFGTQTFLLMLMCSCVLGQREPSASSANFTPFNIDLQFPVRVSASSVIQSRNRNTPSLFATSVLVAPVDENSHNLFVGAPSLVSRFNSSLMPGGLFKCPLDFDRSNVAVSCSEIVFNSEIEIKNLGTNSRGKYVPRNRSLVGFNLYPFFDLVITCAPNWAPQTKLPTPEGLCLVMNTEGNAFRGFKMEIRSNKHLKQSRPYESHSLFGFSLAFDPVQRRMFSGIPGFDDFTGSVSVINSDFDASRLEYSKSDQSKRSSLNTYTGFAVDFVVLGRTRYILLGSPRHEKFKGKVDLIDAQRERMISPLMGSSSNKGEFFGASLLVLDMSDSDKKDLLVGAPFYSQRNRRELGRVYLYRDLQLYLKGQRTLPEAINSKNAQIGAHFGATMNSIDLNRDGFKDVIISAPFESATSADHSGAIYIYYGTPKGLDTDPDHVIRIGAESVSKGMPLGGFGYSLWTEADVDGNGYNDVVAGSVLSETVTILRSIPTIRLGLEMSFDRKGINLTDSKGCNGAENACFRVNYCLTTDARSFEGEIAYSIEFVVTDRKLRLGNTGLSRVVVDRVSTILTSKETKVCKEGEHAFFVQVKKKEDLYDITTPIEMTMTATLQKPEIKTFCKWCPVANPVTIFNEIGFEHGCAKTVCVSRLNLKSTFRYGSDVIGDSIVQGRFDHFEIEVEVHNQGEASIDTLLLISISPATVLMRTNSLADRCRQPNNGNSSTTGLGYVCDVSKVLPKGKNERFKLQFDLETINLQTLAFDLLLNSSSRMAPASRLEATKRFDVTKEAWLKLSGTNQHQNGTSFSDQTPTVLFLSSFLVVKSGPSSVNGSHLQFYLPDGVFEVAKPLAYKCRIVHQADTVLTGSHLINGTLTMPCLTNPEQCTKYECALGAFDSGLKSQNYALNLQFIPSSISRKLNYERLLFQLRLELFADDKFLKQTPYDAIDIDVTFERQITPLSKSNPLIMIGGGGIGLLILLVTVIVLIKNGFFKRKKRDQLLQVKQRMSMNPNLFPSNITGLESEEND